MIKLVFLILLSCLPGPPGTHAQAELAFLTPSGHLDLALGFEYIRMEGLFDLTKVDGAQMRELKATWERLEVTYKAKDWWTKSTLVPYQTGMTSGITHLKAMTQLWLNIENFRNQSASNHTTTDSCILITDLSTEDILADFSYLNTQWTTISTLTADKMAEASTILILREFLKDFRSSTNYWLSVTREHVAQLEEIRDHIFPETLRASLSDLPCLTSVSGEYIDVGDEKRFKYHLSFDLDIAVPKSVSKVQLLQPIAYTSLDNRYSIELYTPPEYKYIHKELGSSIKLVNCSYMTKWQAESMPICHEEAESTCEKALTQEVISDILAHCDFTFTHPEPVIKVSDNGLLIQGISIKAHEDGRTINKPLPLLIYSNKQIMVMVGEDTELTFPAIERIPNPRILTTKLSKTEILQLSTRALWSTFWRTLDIPDYLSYLNLALVIIFGPMSSVALCMNCCCKSKRKNRHIEMRSSRNKKMTKKEKKERTETNLRLLNRAKL